MFANSKKQRLSIHSLGVANLSLHLLKRLQIPQSTLIKKTFENIEKLEQSVFFSGLLHDIGKIDNNFQSFIENKNVTDSKSVALDGVHFLENKKEDSFSFINYPRHNEISWALSTFLLKGDKNAQYAIYYHHAKVIRKDKKNNQVAWGREKIIEKVFSDETLISSVNSFFNEIDNTKYIPESMLTKYLDIKKNIQNLEVQSDNISTPSFLFGEIEYKDYTKQKRDSLNLQEIKNLLIRSIVVSADRIISSLSVEQLNGCLEDSAYEALCENMDIHENTLSTNIENMLEHFSVKNVNNQRNINRDLEQSKIAKKLSENQGIATLFGPAGCGKTKIFLEWYKNSVNKNSMALNDNKKLFIITPRKMICTSLFNELTKEYVTQSKIEIITGEDKRFWNGSNCVSIEESQKSAEITITTVDQLISTMLSHKKIDLLLDFINSYVVFDEFHEFFNIPGVVLLFKLFIRIKAMLNNSKTLLVSATPNYFFLENVLEVNPQESVEYIDTFNKEVFEFFISTYQAEEQNKNHLENSELFKEQAKGSIVIFNTAKSSQDSVLSVNGEDVINFHSKFTPKDKRDIYSNVVQHWSDNIPKTDKVLRSGPIVQASLNISTMNLVTQLCSAENWLQRLGRANRFAFPGVAKVVTVVDEKVFNDEKNKSKEISFLKNISMKEQSLAFLKYLKLKNFSNDKLCCQLNLSDIYSQYKDFHSLDEVKEAYAKDFECVISKSFDIFNKNDFTPKEYWVSLKKLKGKSNVLSSKAMRGTSVYILPVTYQVHGKKIGDWLYIPDKECLVENMLTFSETDLNGKNSIFNNQISVLKNTRIDGFQNTTYGTKYNSMNVESIKIEAKSPTSPLLVSYPDSVTDYKNLNKGGFFYVSKGNVKIGLYDIVLDGC